VTVLSPCRLAAVVLLAGIGVTGCSSGSSDKPSVKVLTGRLQNSGRYALVQAKVDLVDGPLNCVVKLDEKAKTSSYTCTTKTKDGKAVQLQGSSTWKELKNGKKKSVSGTITATVDGQKKLSVTCVGSGC
jgi:hypothetical protein